MPPPPPPPFLHNTPKVAKQVDFWPAHPVDLTLSRPILVDAHGHDHTLPCSLEDISALLSGESSLAHAKEGTQQCFQLFVKQPLEQHVRRDSYIGM